jgi:drug/metabolite transporter (DMT)-like permease
MSTIANRFMGEAVAPRQWLGLALGFGGVALVLHDRTMIGGHAGGWLATFVSLIGITLGTLYQRRWCGGIDWRAGNLVQYAAAAALFGIAACAFETREIRWSVPFALALAWTVLGMSLGAVGLLYWLLRRAPAARIGSLFYLVPAVTAVLAFLLFGERLDALSIAGMCVCAAGVWLVNRGSPTRG